MCFNKKRILSLLGLVRIIIGVCQHVISSFFNLSFLLSEPNPWRAGSERDFNHNPLQFCSPVMFKSVLAKTTNYSQYVAFVSLLSLLVRCSITGCWKMFTVVLNLQSSIKKPRIHDWRKKLQVQYLI